MESAGTPAAPAALSHIQSLPSWLLGRVAGRGHALVGEAVAAEGLKLSHHAVLAAVSERGPLAQADLVRLLGFDPKDTVLLVNFLEGAGLVERHPDPRDRRKNAVTVTGEGAQVLRRCMRAAEAANEHLLAPLGPEEREQLMTLLAKLHAVESAS